MYLVGTLAADAAVLGGFVLAGPVEQDFETFRPRVVQIQLR